MKELDGILGRAENFHGHLGPFLVIGVRMGLIGLRELGLKHASKELQVEALLKDSIPFSCILDGIQVSTGCTLGNQRLTVKNSLGITARLKSRGKKPVRIIVKESVLDNLKTKLSAYSANQEMEKLARLSMSMPEEEIFTIKLPNESNAFLKRDRTRHQD